MIQKVDKSNPSILAYMELPSVAFLLALAAGSMDGYAFFMTKMFATFQTGNVVLAAFSLGNFGWISILPMLYSILAFGLGALFLSYFRNYCIRKGAMWTFKILGIEIFMLILLLFNSIHGLFSSLLFVCLLSFIAGMQGNAFHKLVKMLYANIAVTLDVQLVFGYLADAILLKDERKELFKKALSYLIIFIGFAMGASISAVLLDYLGSFTLIVTILSLVVIFIGGKVTYKKGKRVIDLSIDD